MTIRPRSTQMTRSQSCCTLPRSWLTKSTVAPEASVIDFIRSTHLAAK